MATAATSMTMAVRKSMPDDTAYAMTKACCENFNAMLNANALMRSIDPNDVFGAMNAPLHSGAARYCQEVGIEIPAELMPH